jgi:UDP-N-acetyl-D-mannosaminuronic acid transferase (WecB/TagA/CpsF family)
VIQEINSSGAQMLLVAMGVPRQEMWLNRMMPFLNPTLAFGVGGLFDFLSGRIPRAPTAWQAIGMEWAYRLYQEPKRMWRRYLLGNPLFLARSSPKAGREGRQPFYYLQVSLDVYGCRGAISRDCQDESPRRA